MTSGGFPIDIILFAMIAGFLVLRLRSILGRRTGFERSELPAQPAHPAGDGRAPVIDAAAEPAPAAPRGLPEQGSPAALALMRITDLDPKFTPAAFLDGAERAFRMIVEAFAKGDRPTLQRLLSEPMATAFEQAIAERDAAGHKQTTEVRSFHETRIEEAATRGSVADIVVRFVTDQVSFVVDRDGRPVSGTEAVTQITDVWTFERDLRSPDPAWRLVGARSG